MTGQRAVRLLGLLIAVVLTFAVVITATGVPGDGSPDRAATLDLDGTAEIKGGGGARRVQRGDHAVADGEHIELLSGDGVLRLSGARALELRAGTPGAASQVEVGAIPVVEGGDVLATAGAEELVVDSGGGRLSLVDGAARISLTTGATFVVYEGRAGLTSGGRTLEGGLAPLRQVVVTGTGMVPLAASPLRFAEPPDPWDRRYLGEAIDLQANLERRSTGFTTLLRDDFTPDVFFYQTVLPGLLHQPSFDQTLLDGQDRPVGEMLVGAAVALVGRDDDFAARWDEVFALRSDGAGWGIVAFDQDAPPAALLSVLDGAVARSPLLFGAPSSEPVFEPAPVPVRRRPEPPPLRPAPPVVLPAPSEPVPRPRPVAPPPVVTGPGPDDNGGVLEPVVDPLVDLLDGVLDELGDVTGGLL